MQVSELLNTSAKVIGLKQVLAGIVSGAIGCVIVADDCDDFVKKAIDEAVYGREVEILSCKSRRELGKLSRIDVAAAVVGIIKPSNN